MPVVPRVERQVSLDRLPGVRKTAAETAISAGAGVEAARGQVAEAVGQIGALGANIGLQQYSAIMEKERDHADQVAVLSGQRRISEWKNKRLLDTETGAFAVQGKDAMPLPEQIGAEYAKLTGEIEAGMNERQRLAFAQAKQQVGLSLDLELRRHVNTEMKTYEAGELDGFLKTTRTTAMSHAEDPQLADDLKAGIDKIRAHGPKLGMGPKAVDQKVLEWQSDVHVSVIRQMSAKGKDIKARSYFEAAKAGGQLVGDAIDDLEKLTNDGVTLTNSQNAFDKIRAEGGTLSEQREKAFKLIGDERKNVLSMIEHEDVVNDKIQRDVEEKRFRGVFDKIEQGVSLRALERSPEWRDLEPNQRVGARAYLENRIAGIPTKTDWPAWYGLMERAMKEPQNFATENLLKYRHQLGESEFKQLTNIKAGIVTGNMEAAAKAGLGDFQTNQQIVEGALDRYGIPTSGKDQTPAHRASIAELNSMVAQEVNNFATANPGKKADNAFIEKTTNDILAQQIKTGQGGWFGWFFAEKDKRLVDLTFADMATADRDRIKAARVKEGLATSEALILSTYIKEQSALLKKK